MADVLQNMYYGCTGTYVQMQARSQQWHTSGLTVGDAGETTTLPTGNQVMEMVVQQVTEATKLIFAQL